MSNTESDVDELPKDPNELGEEEAVVEEEPLVLRSEDYISGPFFSEESTIPENILEFDFSYGYDCKKYYNLVVADSKTLMFISGNLLNFLDVETKRLWFRRSAYGGGLGHLTKNPNPEFQHIAVAENGNYPPIIVYEWPSLEIVCILKEGTSCKYTHVNYSPNGDLLASQGGDPDYLITVFNWPKSMILLRTKSNVNDIYRVFFSPYVPGQLTTCGMAHIKFWKMATTFTGLKLQGDLGRFGKTEYSDILGIYPMPDEKVISGSYWGNFLVWEAGLIKIEVYRKLRKTCHKAPIVQFDYRDGEIWTVAMDGKIRVWHYETIDQADPPDDDRVVQTEPVYNFSTPGIMYMCIHKRSNTPTDTFYYAQDGNGGLWKIDLTTALHVTPPERLYRCHAGAVVDIAACPWGTYLASLGIDGCLMLYHYIKRQLMFVHQFPAKGVCMIWLPLEIEPSGDVLLLGFDDGNLRIIVLNINEKVLEAEVSLLKITKPHNKSLTYMSINESGTILVTSGEDSTIFVYQILKSSTDYIELLPIGLIPTTDIVTYITWHRSDDATVILGCLHGYIDQVTVPRVPQDYTTISYYLDVTPKHQRFVTYKAQIRRDIKLSEIEAKKEAKRERKKIELAKFKKDNPGLEVDEELYLEDSESDEELEPLFIPEVPNRVLWIQHTEEDTLWLSMAGFDAGYIYEYFIDQKEEIPYSFCMICDADDVEINNFLYNYNKKYLFFAMQNGAIRIIKLKEDWKDLSDYWQLSMHDNHNGFIPRMLFSYDDQYFFTCGHDGNVFSYKYNPEDGDRNKFTGKRTKLSKEIPLITDDQTCYQALSLQEAIVKKELDRINKLANDHKQEYLDKIAILKKEFQALLKRNNKLLPTQVIPRKMLELDPRITKNLEEKLGADLALVKRKLAFNVEKSEIGLKKLMNHFINPLDIFPICVSAVRKNFRIKTLRQRKLKPEFFEMQQIVEQKIIEAELKGRPPERPAVLADAIGVTEKKKAQLEYFLVGLSPSTIKFKLGDKINRLLIRYRMRKVKQEKRQLEWEKFNARKPIEGVNHPDDEITLAEAIETIGDYKLKSASDYKVPIHLRESTVKKYKQLLNIRQKQFNIRHNFNKKVHGLRDQKKNLRDYLTRLEQNLVKIHNELPADTHKNGPEIIELYEYDFPEKNLEIVLDLPPEFVKKDDVVPDKIIEKPKRDILEKEVLPCLEEGEVLDEGEVITPWERELKDMRLRRKSFEQTQTIKKMEKAIIDYDNNVEATYYERLQVLVDANYIDLHILTLNQELLILKDFEAVEDQLSDNVRAVMVELLDMQDLIMDKNNKIESNKRDIELLEERAKHIVQEFFNIAGENKFYDFLRRIFKKKYRPPKVHGPDDSESESESSSSSSSDEEEDAGSIDSRDVGPIRLDESVCPKGCDQALYDLTFAMRNQRHGVELEIKEHNRIIELTKKEVEMAHKKTKQVEMNLLSSQEELEAYQRLKQQKLNQVMCTVILKLHQLQHLMSDCQTNIVKDTLVFSKTTLSKLYKRVGQLQNETLQQKAKHKLNINHLGRMKTDCTHMARKIHELNGKVEEAMKQKFGKVVDLDEIQEALLKRLVFDLRMSMMDIRSLYEEELILWREKYAKKQTELAKSIRDNTARLELLGLMNHEKTQLVKLLRHQEEKRSHLEMVSVLSEASKRDLLKLEGIVTNQRKEIQILRAEIKVLKTKGFQRRPEIQRIRYGQEEVEEEEELELMELDEDDDCIQIDFSELPTHKAKTYTRIPSNTTVAREILLEMLESLEIDKAHIKDIEKTVSIIMEKNSVSSIVDELLLLLPYEPSDIQQSIVETSAEKLYALVEPQVSEIDICQCASDTLEEILNNTYLSGTEYSSIFDMIYEIVQQVPLNMILKKENMGSIVNKITGSNIDLDKEELIRAVKSITSSQKDEIETVLDNILQEVFGTGLDYLYYIKD